MRLKLISVLPNVDTAGHAKGAYLKKNKSRKSLEFENKFYGEVYTSQK